VRELAQVSPADRDQVEAIGHLPAEDCKAGGRDERHLPPTASGFRVALGHQPCEHAACCSPVDRELPGYVRLRLASTCEQLERAQGAGDVLCGRIVYASCHVT
jgi:hypothetical protein